MAISRTPVSLIAGVVLAFAVYAQTAKAGVIYTLNIPTAGDLVVAGTITTDGNMGPLTLDDIVSFNFTETSASIPYTALFTPATVTELGPGLLLFGVGADATGLYINSSAAGGGYLSAEIRVGPGEYSYVYPVVLPGDGVGHYSDCTVSCLEDSVTDDFNVTYDTSHLINPYDGNGLTYLAIDGVPTSTPEPETFGLMLAGLTLVAVIARRRCSVACGRG